MTDVRSPRHQIPDSRRFWPPSVAAKRAIRSEKVAPLERYLHTSSPPPEILPPPPERARARTPLPAPVRIPAPELQYEIRDPNAVPPVRVPLIYTIEGYLFESTGLGRPYRCVDELNCTSQSIEAAERFRIQQEEKWLRANHARRIMGPRGEDIIKDTEGNCYTYDDLLDPITCPKMLVDEWDYF
jgi:hypothetical protein